MHPKHIRIGFLLKHFSALVAPAILLASTVIGVQAEQMYISDVLVVNVRDRIEPPTVVVDRVMSDAPVTILERNGKFLFIETTEGKQGWIENKYVTQELPKSHIIGQLTEKISELQSSNSMLQQPAPPDVEDEYRSKENATIIKLTKERDALALELQNLRKETPVPASMMLNEITSSGAFEEFKASQQYSLLVLNKENLEQQLAPTRETVPHAVTQLPNSLSESAVNSFISGDSFNNNSMHSIYWFCAGALVFLLGIISGKLPGRRKNRFRF